TVPKEEYLKLFAFLREKYGNVERRWNSFYDDAFGKVAFLKSNQIIVLFLSDATSKRVNLFEVKIADIELAPKIDVPREYYGYLRRHIDGCAGGRSNTFRRGNKFYTGDGILVAEILSPEKLRIHTQIGSGLFAKQTTKEVNIADLKPERIVIPRELLFITKKLFGSYRRFDRRVRMETANDNKASLITSLNVPEAAKAFFGKSTAGLLEEEVNYLITSWAGDIANTRRARATKKFYSNEPAMGTTYVQSPQRPSQRTCLIETAAITVDGQALTVQERLEVISRLGLEIEEPAYLNAATQQNFQLAYTCNAPAQRHLALRRHELRKRHDVDTALRREEEQYAPVTEV
ncbi:MAG: hypothetical protein M1368_12265, partial [Thaumarchaeota archaeon]|nr:hypothetical protein [Nitrososphaerota archaeon]